MVSCDDNDIHDVNCDKTIRCRLRRDHPTFYLSKVVRVLTVSNVAKQQVERHTLAVLVLDVLFLCYFRIRSRVFSFSRAILGVLSKELPVAADYYQQDSSNQAHRFRV